MLLIAAVVLLVLLFQKRRVLPRLMIVFYIFNLAVCAMDLLAIVTFIANAFPEIAKNLIPESAKVVAQALVGTLIWVPYFLVSKRVKNTFVN